MMQFYFLANSFVSFWDSLSSFFTNAWDLIVNFYNTVSHFFELVVNMLHIPNYVLLSSFIPPTLKSVFIFVIFVALIKLVISLGSYSE